MAFLLPNPYAAWRREVRTPGGSAGRRRRRWQRRTMSSTRISCSPTRVCIFLGGCSCGWVRWVGRRWRWRWRRMVWRRTCAGGVCCRATVCSTRRRSLWADSIYNESFPTSPLILNPFNEDVGRPEGAAADADVGVQQLGESARAGPRAAELVRQRAAPDLAGPGRADPDPLVYAIKVAGRHAFVHHLAGAADRLERSSRRCRSTRPARQYAGGNVADLAGEHDLRVQRHCSRAR